MDASWINNLGQIRLIPYGVYEPALNMALDRLLLQGTESVFRLYGWSQPTLSLGRNQKDFHDLNQEALKACALVRRDTGGQAVLHQHELTYSFVGSIPPLPQGVLESYRFLSRPLSKALTSLGVAVTSGEYKKFKPRGSHCFLEPSAYELLLEGKKLIGSAQRRQGKRLLQHGAILLKRDLDLWLALWPNADGERFTGLSEAGYSFALSLLTQALEGAFADVWQGRARARDFTEKEMSKAQAMAAEFKLRGLGV